MLAEKVWPFFGVYREFDIVGQFYGEFLKYTGGDGKGLGIVLTPRHITEIFAMLANVTKDSKVLDLCAGTGGFLISAMHQMGRTAVTDADHKAIREKGLVGVEQQPHMFALAASNMILRGDGKANLYQGSCFDDAIAKAVKVHECNVGLLNPPYSQKATDLHELAFVKQMLDCLAPGGTGIAVVQMSNAIAPNRYRDEILKVHTLEAVMSLPSDLFYPVGVVTCIMVFTAHKSHASSDRKTWFGYWKDDAHTKVKHLGRLDRDNRWPRIRDRWVTAFRNREVHAGESVQVKVTAADEWCAEAYMDTNYSSLTTSPFAAAIKDYVAYRLRVANADGGNPVATKGWKPFTIGDLFEIKKGKRLTNATMKPGNVPFIGAIEDNNGVRTYIGQTANHKGNTITVNYNGSVAEAFYQPDPFWASDDVNVLYPKFKMNPIMGLFIAAVIRQEKYRFNYGRKWHLERMASSSISLPAKKNGEPDFQAMEALMLTLPLAKSV
ncbi:MAG: N-6 DNA methylase [bacterium]|jgi:type I restriction enzyme M protein